MAVILEILAEAWAVFGEMAPYILFGFLVAGLLSVALTPAWIERHLGGRGIMPVLKASLFGVPLPLCSCGVIPVSAGLRKHGASKGATIAFLLSTPQTGVDSILITGSLLGWPFACFRVIAAFITGLIGGWLVDHIDGAPSETPTTESACTDSCCNGSHPHHADHWLRRALRFGFVTLPKDLARSLLIGVLVAGLIAAMMPEDAFASYVGTGFLSMIVMMLFGMPLYVCASASVPIAYALWQYQGVTAGAALVFLITGPATNAATIAVIARVLGKRVVALYLATVAVSALASGLLMDSLLTASANGTAAHMHASPLWSLLQTLAALALLGLFLPGLWPHTHTDSHDETSQAKRKPGSTVTLQISGMTCAHCAAAVTATLKGCAHVTEVNVNMKTGKATLYGENIDTSEILVAVKEAGYAGEPVADTTTGNETNNQRPDQNTSSPPSGS